VSADINFMTISSRSTALLLAARYARSDVVKSLLKFKPAEVSVKDKFHRTPLFYASGNGDEKTVRSLVQAKARSNDGSLHEAMREIHPDVVRLLLKSGHDPNFSSSKHGGLTALGELCMYGDGNGLGGQIDDCIDLLVKARLDPMKKWHGKTLLHMALENPVPLPITSALLERVMYKHVNDTANVFHYQGLCYSPTMVLAKGHFVGTPDDCSALISLLKSNGAVDVYYAEEGSAQPPDAVGMPKVILDAERRRRRHEEDRRMKLEKDMDELRAAQVKHEQYMTHQEERFQQRFYHQQQLNAQDIQHKQQQAEIKRRSEQQTLQFKQRSLQIDAASQYAKLATKQRMNALNRQSQRDAQIGKANMNRLAMQKGAIDARARGVRNAQDAARNYSNRAHANWMAARKRLR
jgi:hypothetical protein